MSLGLSLRGLLIRLPSLSPLCACPHLHSAVSGLPHVSLGDFPQDLFTSVSTGTLVFPSRALPRGGRKKLCHFLALNPSVAPLLLGMSCTFGAWATIVALATPPGLISCRSLPCSLHPSPPLRLRIRPCCLCLRDFAHAVSILSPLPLSGYVLMACQFLRKALLTPLRRTGCPTPPLSAFVIRGTARSS